jgi:hypothetical protein
MTGEVRKLVEAGADDRVLEARYTLPSGVTGQNLRAFSDQTDTDHERSLMALWLFTVVGLYEVWAAELPIDDSGQRCQFPTRGYNEFSRRNPGVGAIINGLQPSRPFTAIYGAAVAADDRMISRVRLDDALAVYRLFKECRNSLAHTGGAANDRVPLWGVDVQARATDLLVDRSGDKVAVPIFAEGAPVAITFEQMRAFVSLLFRVVFTIDAALLTSKIGEDEISRRWTGRYGQEPVRVDRRKLNRGNWIIARLAEIGAPEPPAQADIIAHLVNNNLIRDTP